MHHFTRQIVRLSTALALASSAFAAQATLIDNHVLVGPTYGGFAHTPNGYEAAYSIRLGYGSWPFPYIDLYVDAAEGKSSYTTILAAPSYLTYIQNVSIAQVKAGDEISASTLKDGSLPSFVEASTQGYSFIATPLYSPTGNDPDIYLGFSYSNAYSLNPTYGWAHLRYTQDSGLNLISSAMTTSDAGIFALTRETIPAIPEPSSMAMLCLGLSGIVGVSAARRRRQTSHT